MMFPAKSPRFAFASLACILLAAVSAFAVPPAEVHRSTTQITVTGPCCQNISGETVKITEPVNVTPVVLEWSMEHVSSGPFAVGVSVNGGGCGDFGPEFVPQASAANGTPFRPLTIQWVILPSDGLVKGANTFAVCEGPSINNADTMTIGTRTSPFISRNRVLFAAVVTPSPHSLRESAGCI